MKEKLLLVDSGGLGRVTLEHAIKKYECFFIDDNYSIGDTVCDIPIVGRITDLQALSEKYRKMVITIGETSIRERIYKEAKEIGYLFPNIVHSSVYISPYAHVGEACVILNNVVIQNGSHVGNGVVLNPGVEIHHDSFVDDYAVVYTNSVIRTYAKVGKRVTIESNVSIGNNSMIVDDSIIENGKSIFSC